MAGRDKVPTLSVVLQRFAIRPGCGLERFWDVFRRFALRPKACGAFLEHFRNDFWAFLEGLRCVRQRAERFYRVLKRFVSVVGGFALHNNMCGAFLKRFCNVFKAFVEGLCCVRKRAERCWIFF